MRDDSLISVIMPVYNGMPFLCEAVESILSQSYENFELIIVDDGSMDESRKYINSICDTRVKLFFLEQNKGIVNALNLGIANAKGHFIARMDQDDIALPNRLNLEITYLIQNPHVSMVSGKIDVFSDSPEISKEQVDFFHEKYNRHFAPKDIEERLRNENCINHPTIMLRREIFDIIGFYDKNFELTEDYELFIRIVQQGAIFKFNDIIQRYRIHPKQMSTAMFAKQRLLESKVRRHHGTYCKFSIEGDANNE